MSSDLHLSASPSLSSPVASSSSPSEEVLHSGSASHLMWSSFVNEVFSSNLLWAEWISFSASVSLIGILVIFCSNIVPEAIQRVFKYGKAADLHVTSDGIKQLHKIELPKRYVYSCLISLSQMTERHVCTTPNIFPF